MQLQLYLHYNYSYNFTTLQLQLQLLEQLQVYKHNWTITTTTTPTTTPTATATSTITTPHTTLHSAVVGEVHLLCRPCLSKIHLSYSYLCTVLVVWHYELLLLSPQVKQCPVMSHHDGQTCIAPKAEPQLYCLTKPPDRALACPAVAHQQKHQAVIQKIKRDMSSFTM